uniref:DUF1190 domain-containing protein n=1 Tax=Halomonas sp. TaxID=1486246 RepID=UPI002619BD68|nr:DUF1190 domain-containing protein [Halomonas sp.]
MKRTASINLARMRKAPVPKRLAMAVAMATAAIATAGCSNNEREAKVYLNAEDCTQVNPGMEAECKAAYQSALQEAASSGPKYDQRIDCESDFGPNQCVAYQPEGATHSWFMPAMAGFLLAKALDRNRYQSTALYTSGYYGSPIYGKWSTVDGYSFRRGGRTFTVDDSAFKPKPAVTRTISRGGFGSKVSAKSSFGGSRSRSGWGG